jgi:glutathione S-transferase
MVRASLSEDRTMSDLTLYIDDHWNSPYALSCFIALREKGLPFELKEVSLPKKQHLEPAYRDAAITGRVPALRHGDYWLSESQAIGEYLAETFPSPKFPRLFPEDLKERGRARQLMAWVRSDLMPIREERSTTTVFYEQFRTKTPLSAAGRAAAENLLRAAKLVITEGRPTLFANWCLADADFTMMLSRLVINGDPVEPKVKAYVEANWKRPSMKEWLDHKRKTYEPY